MLRTTATPSAPIRPDAPGGAVYDRLTAEPDTLLIAVVDEDDRPVGLIERNSFALRMASQYGRALYAARPVSMLMETQPLLVEGDRDLTEFTASMLTDRPSDLLRGFIVVQDGRYLGVSSALELLRAANETARRSVAELGDLARSLEAAKAAAERDKLFTSTIVEAMPAMLCVRDVIENRFVLINRAAERALGWTRREMIGRRCEELFAPEEARTFAEQDRTVLASGAVCEIDEETVHGEGGRPLLLRTRKLAVSDEAGRPRYILVVSEDISERKAAQAQIEHMAHYDTLTGLSNRMLFQRQLDAALRRAEAAGGEVAVMCIDLDHFKTVNDTLGHAAGDALLRLVAERLRVCTRADDSVARLGGDEFAVVQAGLHDAAEAVACGARIVEALSRPFEIAGREVCVGASVGLALYPRHAVVGDEILKRADLALYRAKREGRGNCRLFEPAMDEGVRARRALELDLRDAIGRGEFRLHYQPQLDLAQDRVSGCEALLRWPRADGGWTSPAEFIPAAEGTGLIGPLGEWVLRAACHAAVAWPDGRKLAVNVSPAQFRSKTLVPAVVGALASSGLPPQRLELEITESVLMQNDETNLRQLRQLKELGCDVALDDFGTGYSSLSYLRAFPFDKVKIDQSFVRDLPDNRDALAIVTAIVNLAHSLGMRTTAEGVETEAQLHCLRRIGCAEAQGFLIGRPAPLDDAPPRPVAHRAAA